MTGDIVKLKNSIDEKYLGDLSKDDPIGQMYYSDEINFKYKLVGYYVKDGETFAALEQYSLVK